MVRGRLEIIATLPLLLEMLVLLLNNTSRGRLPRRGLTRGARLVSPLVLLLLLVIVTEEL